MFHDYAPTSDSSGYKIGTFYDDVECVAEPSPRRDVLIVTDDQNGKIESDNTG